MALRIFLTAMLLWTLTRLVIAARLESTGWTRDPAGILKALGAGIMADAGAAAVLAALGIILISILARPRLRRVGQVVFLGFITLLVFGAVAECFFWEEFASRLNGIAVFYLLFPREVIGNLHESFNLPVYLPLVGTAGLVIWWQHRHALRAALYGPRIRFQFLGGTAIAAVVAIAGGVVSGMAPQRVSANREINQLALNGTANMLHAALTNDSRYDGVYPGIPEPEALPLMRELVTQDNVRFLDSPTRRSIRRFVDNGTTPRRLNIVVVLEESFGSRFVDVLDDDDRPVLTPVIDRLADESLFFNNVYASGQRTVRGLEAVLTSFTPIPGISTARRPGSEGMFSLPRVLGQEGYQTTMLYAGRALFDNMGTFWRGIGFDEVLDQSDISNVTFSTAWGVCDEDLFTEALARMDTAAGRGKPFMLGLLTVSNHRPYKFPEGEVEWDDSMGGRSNTVRYADWAFGNFIERARAYPWFDDTVFVFVADHGHKVNGAADVPLHRYRIPMLFYSPKHIEPRRVDTLTAQIDLAPTLLGLLDLSYESNFFGIDALRVPPGGGRIAVAHNFSVAFAVPGHAVVLEPDGEEKGYRFQPGNPALDPEPPDPEVSRLARAVTQSAHRMFYAREYHVADPAASGITLVTAQQGNGSPGTH